MNASCPRPDSAPCTLVLNWTSARCTAAVTRANDVLGQCQAEAKSGQRSILPGEAGGLPSVVAAALAEGGVELAGIARIVVVTGPGSFTALRTTVAYAQGLALSLAIPVVGVSVGDALRAGVSAEQGASETWFVGRDRLGRVLLDRGEGRGVQAIAADDLPVPDGPVTLIGAAASEMAAHLGARSPHVRGIERAEPTVAEILRAAELTRGGEVSRPVRPLYVEAPAAIANEARGRPAPKP